MNILYPALLCVSLAVIQVLVGGTLLLYALPAYAILAIVALCSAVDLRRPKLPPNGWCLLSSLVFFGYVLARAALSPVTYLAREDGLMVTGALIVYLLTTCYLTDPRRRLWVLGGFLALAACNLAIGVRQFAGDDRTTVFGFLRSAQYGGRASGFYICPDHLAGFLEMTICLGLSAAVWSRTRPWIKILVGYVTVCCVAGLVLTGSRGGYLSLGVGLVVFTLLALQRVRVTSPENLGRALTSLVGAAIIVVVALGVVISHNQLLGDRASQLVDTRDIRVRIWPAAIREFQQSPIVGTGASTFLYYGRRFRDPVVQMDPIRTHSDYLQMLAEYGAVGAAGLLFFLGTHLTWGWLTFRRWCRRSAGQGGGGGSNAVAWNIGALSATSCLVAHSVVDFNLHIPANTLTLAFIFGVLANPGRSVDPDGEQVARFRRIDLLPRLVLPALALVILIGGLPKLPGEYYAEKARVALRDHHDALALIMAVKGVEREQDNPLLYNYLGQARLDLGGSGPDTPGARSFREAAVQALTEAVRLAPQDSTFLGRLGEAQARLNDFPAAEKTFQQALIWDPNSAWVWTYDGVYLQQRGLYEQAASAFQRALSLGGNVSAGKDLEEVLRHASVSAGPPVREPGQGTARAGDMGNSP